MAEKVWLFALAVSVVLLVGALTKARVRIASAVIALILSMVTALWIGTTAHHGGTLVYAYGAGTPVPVAEPIGEAASVANDQSVGDVDPDNGEPEPVDDPRLVHFREHVKPVIETVCIKCHNPPRKRRSGDLDQTTMAGMLEGGMSGPTVVPGDPDASWLIMAIRHEEDMVMPPNEERLSDEVIAAFEQWVRDGAVWEPLTPPPPPPPPDAEAPAADATETHDDLDH